MATTAQQAVADGQVNGQLDYDLRLQHSAGLGHHGRVDFVPVASSR